MQFKAQYPFEPYSLVDYDHIDSVADRFPEYQQAVDWINDFVIKEHSEMGRQGAVCPLLEPALQANLLWFVAITVTTGTRDEACAKGLHLAELYRTMFSTAREFRHGSLLAFFPRLARSNAADFIDQGHKGLRLEFVSRGLMIGEFHRLSQVASVHNPTFKVMQCPVPMFAVRALSAHDIVFLDRDETPPDERAQYLRYYLEFMGRAIKPSTRARAERNLSAALAKTATGVGVGVGVGVEHGH